MFSPFDILYHADNRDHDEHYRPPATFEHGVPALVATFQGAGDGLDVEVYETRVPARFYSIKALDGVNSVGEPKRGFTLNTGSSMFKLAFAIARAISEGMLGLDTPQTQ